MDQSRNIGRAGSMYDHGRAVSTVRTPVGHRFPQGGGLATWNEALSPEVMLTRSSLDIPPAVGGALMVGALTQIASCRESLGGGGSEIERASSPGGNYGWN